MLPISKKIGLCLSILHFLGFIFTVVIIYFSSDPQASLLWGIFAVIDFPISLVYFGARVYAKIVNSLGQTFFVQILYLPHIVHGLLGTIWWYFLPRLVSTKKYGGIWGKEKLNP